MKYFFLLLKGIINVLTKCSVLYKCNISLNLLIYACNICTSGRYLCHTYKSSVDMILDEILAQIQYENFITMYCHLIIAWPIRTYSMALVISNYIPQILCDVIIFACHRYLLLVHEPSYLCKILVSWMIDPPYADDQILNMIVGNLESCISYVEFSCCNH